jgi:hypothetical protein
MQIPPFGPDLDRSLHIHWDAHFCHGSVAVRQLCVTYGGVAIENTQLHWYLQTSDGGCHTCYYVGSMKKVVYLTSRSCAATRNDEREREVTNAVTVILRVSVLALARADPVTKRLLPLHALSHLAETSNSCFCSLQFPSRAEITPFYSTTYTLHSFDSIPHLTPARSLTASTRQSCTARHSHSS